MKNKKVIFNSDDFGHSNPFNMGIFKGIKSGILTTSCVLANLEGYMEAVSLKSDLKGIKFGIHLNLIEGKAITTNKLLTDSKGAFNNNFVDILKKSNDKDFLNEIEYEFRAQIERVLGDFETDHINSHIHIHSIPNLFKLTCTLAREYKINYVRTQFEKFYYSKFIPPINLVKQGLLNHFTKQNRKNLPEGILTNDYLIGVQYTGFMDKGTVLSGLKAIKEGVAEILIHPAYYEKEVLKPNNYREFLITENPTLIEDIKALGFEFYGCSFEKEAVCAK